MVGVSKSIALVGMMGAGKSTVGRLLAEALGAPFVDLDREIERREGRPVPEIFERDGEAAFRKMEKRMLGEVLKANPGVIGLGGGAFIEDDIRKALAGKATTVWLKGDAEILYERASRTGGRPLLGTLEDFENRLKAREPFYAQADFTVDIAVLSPQKAVDEILRVLSQ